ATCVACVPFGGGGTRRSRNASCRRSASRVVAGPILRLTNQRSPTQLAGSQSASRAWLWPPVNGGSILCSLNVQTAHVAQPPDGRASSARIWARPWPLTALILAKSSIWLRAPPQGENKGGDHENRTCLQAPFPRGAARARRGRRPARRTRPRGGATAAGVRPPQRRT